MIPLRLLQNQRRRSSSSGWLQPKRALKIFFQHEVNRVHLKLKLQYSNMFRNCNNRFIIERFETICQQLRIGFWSFCSYVCLRFIIASSKSLFFRGKWRGSRGHHDPDEMLTHFEFFFQLVISESRKKRDGRKFRQRHVF